MNNYTVEQRQRLGTQPRGFPLPLQSRCLNKKRKITELVAPNQPAIVIRVRSRDVLAIASRHAYSCATLLQCYTDTHAHMYTAYCWKFKTFDNQGWSSTLELVQKCVNG